MALDLSAIDVAFPGRGLVWLSAGIDRFQLSVAGLASLSRGADGDEDLARAVRRLGGRAASHATVPAVPLVFGDLVVVDLLGEGSFGKVFRAHDRDTGEAIALKVLRNREAWHLESFKHEFRALADVIHPALVTPDELFEARGHVALAMRLVRGEELHCALASAAGEAGAVRDPLRVHSLVEGLIAALAALHAHGLVHMDIKPGNVLVEGERVQLLDFGLSRLWGPGAAVTEVGGTPHYMAPEQLFGAAPAPAMDVYALGVLLYEAFAGVRPFTGAADPIFARIDRPAPPLASRRPGLGEPWCSLVDAALTRDPGARPSPQAILERLGTTRRRTRVAASFPPREAALRELQGWWSEVHDGPVLALVGGEPGTGKTELVRAFAALVRAEAGVVVWGRCYEREALPRKAIDGAVQSLAGHLAGDPELLAAAVAVPGFAALRRLFTALDALAPAAELAGDDPQDTVHAAGEALAGVLQCVTRQRPVLWVIDDAHWGDSDSVELLFPLLVAAGMARLLVVLTHRGDAPESSALLAAFEARLARGVPFRVARLQLAPLPSDAVTRLVAAIADLPAEDARVVRAVERAAGNPLLAEMLARDLDADDDAQDLSSVVQRRLAAFPPEVRRFVACAAVAGRATELRVLADAAGVTVPSRETLAALQAERLLRRATAANTRLVVHEHDLIRHAVMANLGEAERGELHRRLATTLACRSRDSGVIASHFLAAGDRAHAFDWACRGAAEAEHAGAFSHAAELWGIAGQVAEPREQRAIRLRRARALTATGECRAAAVLFSELAAVAGSAAEARALLRASAEAWLLAGDVERGLAALAPALRQLGLAPPARGTLGALRLLAGLLRLLVGGSPRPRDRATDELSGERVDLCWAAAKGLMGIDPLPSLEFLLRAVHHGARGDSWIRLSRPLGLLATLLGQFPGLRRLGDRWSATLQAREAGDAELTALGLVWRGTRAYLRGDPAGALAAGRQALDRLHPSAWWERVQAASMVARILRNQGELTACTELARSHLRDAERRGDRYAQMLFGDYQILPAIARGAVEEADARLAWMADIWLPHDRYTVQSFYVFFYRAYALLHAGRVADAAASLVANRPAYRRAGIHRYAFSRIDHDILETRVALACAAPIRGFVSVTRLLERLAREPSPEATCNAALLAAGHANRRGRAREAEAALRLAIEIAGPAGITMETQAARVRLAQIAGDMPAVSAALAAIRRLGVREPAPWVDIVAPGFDAYAST